MKPPAKLSPAPVGSCGSSSGNAGTQNTPFLSTSIAPYSPRFTTSVDGPILKMCRAAAFERTQPAARRAAHFQDGAIDAGGEARRVWSDAGGRARRVLRSGVSAGRAARSHGSGRLLCGRLHGLSREHRQQKRCIAAAGDGLWLCHGEFLRREVWPRAAAHPEAGRDTRQGTSFRETDAIQIVGSKITNVRAKCWLRACSLIMKSFYV